MTMGIHHVTGIAGDAQQNVDFYAGVLGLRLVKKTIIYDDPRTYHLYYGDTEGTPGSLLTFFPWPGARRGRAGVGQIAVTSLAIAPESIGYWLHRFVTNGVNHDALTRPFGNATIAFRDRDGLMLELVATEDATVRGAWADGPVPSEHAIHGDRKRHTSELQSHSDLVCRLLLEQKNRDHRDHRRLRLPPGQGQS